MCFFRRKPKLDLIDLHKYEHQCMRRSAKPPSTIIAMSYTEEEKAIMRDNQRQAMEIYEHYKNA